MWKLSQFRTESLVEVRAKSEILATLDENGRLDGLPFMPEMLQFCGQQFRVRAVAHKTCETAKQTWQGRRMDRTVHLTGPFCDGSAHGGCQAGCTLFWKDAWLRPVDSQSQAASPKASPVSGPCNEARLGACTEVDPGANQEERCYSCQATGLFDATRPLRWWDLRQYFYDVWTGNHSLRRVLRVNWLATMRAINSWRLPGYRVRMWLQDRMHRALTGRGTPMVTGKFKRGERTPVGALNLRPGELVRIKSKVQIEQTLDERGLNRGLSFDKDEMVPFCGRVVRVRSVVTKIIDEMTGKMRYMKQPCIMLEGVVCKAESASCRLNCPREIPSYWREIWLERVSEPAPSEPPTAEPAAETPQMAASA